ncbi:MAG TPA: hypothetical protein PK668_13520 [Myxococcota bacterium]|nr:hypothetical protein [Myxococcota bacterium]HRY94118.1 hypothetical protein [Myxococcota bacterium]HSA22919.1 hypothetical protein [Myxococcota bacterium]
MAEEKANKKAAAVGEAEPGKTKVDATKRRNPGAATPSKKAVTKTSSKQAPKDWDHVT